MIKNDFDKGPEGWCSYDYHASMVADGSNIFILATWAAQGWCGQWELYLDRSPALERRYPGAPPVHPAAAVLPQLGRS